MLCVERALTIAAKQLPTSLPRGAKDSLFWTAEAQRRIDEAVAQHGEGARAHTSKCYAAELKRSLAAKLEVTKEQDSCWRFMHKVLAFGNDQALSAPLAEPMPDGQPPRMIVDRSERIEYLAKSHAAISSNPEGVDAQADLAAVVREMSAPGAVMKEWRAVGVTELRACVAPFATGRCADFLGLKAEHLKLLDDTSLAELVLYVDRCLKKGVVPKHWRSATVTPVPKRNRDLSIAKSWRPVSVTALLCRLCETVVNNRITHQLEQGVNRSGKSQFGFRRGLSTALPLSGLSMFIRDGFRQTTQFTEWDARDPAERDSTTRGAERVGTASGRKHVTLLVSIDGSDAFCRALPAKAVRKLLDIGCVNEARWVASLLTGRTLEVKDGDLRSSEFSLERGAPQGSILGPLLWSLVIDDLIAKCEETCRTPLPGCIVVPIVFADDINFAIRGFNPTSMVEQANRMLGVVREWATSNGVPMAKLQASWIVGGTHAPWAENWTAADGTVTYDADVHCVPSTKALKLLGITFDSRFAFGAHVEEVLKTCERMLKLLIAVSGVTKADKLRILHEGLILSRMLYAADVWYPYLSNGDKARLQSMHYRACCVVAGCSGQPDGASVCYEAGFRVLGELVRREIVKSADKLRRMPDGCCDQKTAEVCFGPAWVARLFRDGAMPTAALRPVICKDGSTQQRAAAVWPPPGWRRTADDDAKADAKYNDTLRDIGLRLLVNAPNEHKRGYDPRLQSADLRPLSTPHPFPPDELALFDTHVKFITAAPGGLIKPKEPIDLWSDEVKKRFADANAARMQELAAANGAKAIYVFTDGSREEEHLGRNPERCAGAFVVCGGPLPTTSAIKHAETVPTAPIACVYAAELLAIDKALGYVIANSADLFRYRPKRLVLVTDSKSSLESMRTTWLSRISRKEQEATRKLHDLAKLGIHVTLAFVFSHVGGAPGNAHVDDLAAAGCKKYGTMWHDPLWNVDTTRRVLRDRHNVVDKALAAGSQAKFRFRNVPDSAAPSGDLPADMPRWKERLVYRARVGMLPAAGGMLHGVEDECPFCRAPAVLGRDGRTIDHLVNCVPGCTRPPVQLVIGDFWSNPTAAASALATTTKLAQVLSPRGRGNIHLRGRHH